MEPTGVPAVGISLRPPPAIRRPAASERPAVNFDIDDYKARTGRLRWDDLDLDVFADEPLDADTLRCLGYMHDVEHHTVCYLRDLLATPAHQDPEITTFLGFWTYEEYWHGEAIGAVLAAHRLPSGTARIERLRQRLGWRDRVRPLISAFGSAVVGRRLLALDMTWGAINEWTTQAGSPSAAGTPCSPS